MKRRRFHALNVRRETARRENDVLELKDLARIRQSFHHSRVLAQQDKKKKTYRLSRAELSRQREAAIKAENARRLEAELEERRKYEASLPIATFTVSMKGQPRAKKKEMKKQLAKGSSIGIPTQGESRKIPRPAPVMCERHHWSTCAYPHVSPLPCAVGDQIVQGSMHRFCIITGCNTWLCEEHMELARDPACPPCPPHWEGTCKYLPGEVFSAS
jgi:hypothetical protein